MEENKNKENRLSYDELNKVASELHQNYQKLMGEYRKALEALNRRDFEYTSFFLQMLFKVTEHPELYRDEFVKWAVENIEGALTSFAENMKAGAETEQKEEGKEQADEAE